MKNFYITTTLPYVNADLHVGHAMELIRADVIARFKKLQGFNVFFNTGTDEHGMKIFEAAVCAEDSAAPLSQQICPVVVGVIQRLLPRDART